MKIALVFCDIDNLFSDCQAGVFSIFESNPPLGLCAIGTIAKMRGYEVHIFDQLLLKYDNKKLMKKLIEYKPDMVGFSCTSLNIKNSLECAKQIKQSIGCLVFAGGIHISLCLSKVREEGIFDFLISGEGEEVFECLLEKLENGESLNEIKIDGFSEKSERGNVCNAILKNIDQPMIDRSILDIDKYSNKGALLTDVPCYSLFSSRGCPFMCKFCSKPDYFKKYRQREIKYVIYEIKHLITEYGAKAISFREDNFTVDIPRLKEFCKQMIEEFNGSFYWECESRADLPADILELMYKAGCRGIWCGVETIIPRWSKWINKGLDRETVELFYDNCKRIGIKTGALFMFGFPEETEEEIEEDVSFAMSLPTEFSAFQCLAIFPGSPLADYYALRPEIKYSLTDEVSLALIRGYTYKEMVEMEKNINKRIRSNRM